MQLYRQSSRIFSTVRPTLRRTVSICVILTCLIPGVAESYGQGTLIPLTTRRGMVFDHASRHLYVTTTDGWLRRYNLATDQFETGYQLGGSLNGLDISPDDSFVLVAKNTVQDGQAICYRVDLASGSVTNISFTPISPETGVWSVAIGSNGRALCTGAYGGSGVVSYVRQIDLATNTVTVRNDVAGSAYQRVTCRTEIHRSADGTRLYFSEGDISSGPFFTYNAVTDTFDARFETRGFGAGFAVNRNGTILATHVPGLGASLDTASGLHFLHSFSEPDGALAFDGMTDSLYAISGTSNEIILYGAANFVEVGRIAIGEKLLTGITQFGTGNLVVSDDGRYLAVATPSGIRIFSAAAITPARAPHFGRPRYVVFDHAGQNAYITTEEGLIWPYHLGDGSLGTPYNLGGSLRGADITPDDQFLLVAQGLSGVKEGAFQKLELATGTVKNITYPHQMINAWVYSGEWGAWDVAITSNGLAFGTTASFLIGGSAPLRQIDLSTDLLTPRSDPPGSSYGGIDFHTAIERTPDGSGLCFFENYASYSFAYNAPKNSFYRIGGNQGYTASTTLNWNGKLVGTRLQNGRATINEITNFAAGHTFPALDSGIVFDPTADALYGVNSLTDHIIAYDTNTYIEKFRFDVGEDMPSGGNGMGSGTLFASNDGRNLALITPTTVRFHNIEIPPVNFVGCESMMAPGGVEFPLVLPLDGPLAYEGRVRNTADYTFVFTFGASVATVGGASVSFGVGTVSDVTVDPDDNHQVIVRVTGVPSPQTVKVTLADVFDSLGNYTPSISQRIGILLGDTNGDRVVNSADVNLIRNASGQRTNASNFRLDLNSNGQINASDVVIARSRLGQYGTY